MHGYTVKRTTERRLLLPENGTKSCREENSSRRGRSFRAPFFREPSRGPSVYNFRRERIVNSREVNVRWTTILSIVCRGELLVRRPFRSIGTWETSEGLFSAVVTAPDGSFRAAIRPKYYAVKETNWKQELLLLHE